MTRWRATTIASCFGLLGVAFLPSSKADEWNKKTVLTVNEQLMIPGATLEPGKYVMKLMDSQSNRHIVQVFNEDESKLITTVLAIPNYRLQPTGETQFGFWEMPSGQPRALRSWFYPGDNFGQEFAFPKDAAQRIAQVSGEAVPAIVSDSSDMASADAKRITPERQQEEIVTERQTTTQSQSLEQQSRTAEQQSQTAEQQAQSQPVIPQPPEQPAPSSQVTTPDTSATAQTQDRSMQQQRQLPSTASPYPLAGLAGLLAMGAAAAAGLASRRMTK